jgi:hypothetical protein
LKVEKGKFRRILE